MIRFEQARKVYGSVVAVAGLSLEVARGETLCLIGTSGSGKTTALKMVNRLIEPSEGSVWVDGRNTADADPIALRRGIGYVVQGAGLLPHMTVAKNVGVLCKLEGWSKTEIRARVEALLTLVNLPYAEFGERLPRELSGGQRQRVGFARALALDPPVILMDEPFGALDPLTRDGVHEEFLALQHKVAKTIVMVTHDLTEAFKFGDRIALMDAGHLVQAGTRDDLLAHPANDFVRNFMRAHGAGA